MFGYFLSFLMSLFFLPHSLRDSSKQTEILFQRVVNQPCDAFAKIMLFKYLDFHVISLLTNLAPR